MDDGEELYLFASNDGKLYERAIKPAYRRLSQMSAAGKYTRDRAVAVFRPIMSHAVDMYRREIGPRSFSPKAKTEAATSFVEYFESEFKLGNMPH